MIYRMRKKFIGICMLSILAVFGGILIAVCLASDSRTDRQMDGLTDIISDNDGVFPRLEEKDMESMQEHFPSENILTMESPFSTRYFTVWLEEEGTVSKIDTSAVVRISQEEAWEYGLQALEQKNDRGWLGDYRYKRYPSEEGCGVVFVDGSVARSMSRNFKLTCAAVILGGTLVVLLLVILLSKYAIRPIAQSYEKQKRFITDANHELKTPLTLILTNVEIAQSEVGPNEWLQDAKEEGERMSALIRRLISLARMDEEETSLEVQCFSLSAAVLDSVAAFRTLAQEKGLALEEAVSPEVMYTGDEGALRQLLSILLDNAVKYCDPRGMIRVTLKKCPGIRGRGHVLLTVDNSCAGVGSLKLDQLFDRFYRADSARTAKDGFGVGLSIAKSIVEKHRGRITAQNLEGNVIRFKVRL